MEIQKIQEIYASHPGVRALLNLLQKGEKETAYLQGLCGSSSALIISGLIHEDPVNTFFIVLNDRDEAGYLYHDLTQICGQDRVLFFPSSYRRAIRYGHSDDANHIMRTEVISRLNSQKEESKGLVIITHPEALCEKIPSKKSIKDSTLNITVGDRIDRAIVEEMLSELGFKEHNYVYEPGQYAIRGSLVDVYSYSNEFPFRIDFFGDEVESIRTFEISTQLSKERVNEATIVSQLSDTASSEKVSILSMLPQSTILIAKDSEFIEKTISKLRVEGFSLQAKLSDENKETKLPDLINGEEFSRWKKSVTNWEIGIKKTNSPGVSISFDTTFQPLFQKDFDLVSSSLKSELENGYRILLMTDDLNQGKRLETIFRERGDEIPFTPIQKTIHCGYRDNTLRLSLYTDHQLFGRFHKYRLKSEKIRGDKVSLTLKELKEFRTGDFVVHMDHGIGRFGGLVRIPNGNSTQEAIKLSYKNEDVVFVSIHNLHKISKYRGKEGEVPSLNKLGTGAWERMKERTKSKIKDIARDLIKLYSKRREEEGFEYSADSYLQHELEASFIYEDTPDQLKATKDVKADMERKRPMDRLICGDVGFGKTEIAIRAAFKAATDGKQVAVLVPTTVLAYQHYLTFKERLKEFPCTIEYLSRARSAKESKRVLQEIKDGKTDIVIGTHKLTGKETKFKDLGLLIIDEEQKFGVSIKEKLRQIKSNVDTLTMTATPIPRTLQFSLLGARDLSIIQTPPPNRYPIHTQVHTFDAELIKEAINFEMSRNGQVFFINNRVSNMRELENMIHRHVPDAKVRIGHGQMEPIELEKILFDFINHDFDVLIATSIIENGIDIPNVNTIIINQAHYFGLSDLHQMRGRVGRSNKKAFCYLLSPPKDALTPEARRRLEALENFNELGSGISIALQDLDIRGAGNLLGAQQSGFIADLGYETYQKILAEAVKELKDDEFAYLDFEQEENKEKKSKTFVSECLVESDLELLFPALYVPDSNERILLYRELDSIDNKEEIQSFITRMEDRFGSIPKEGKELIKVVTLREAAKNTGVEKVYLKGERMTLFLVDNPNSPYYQSDTFGKLINYLSNTPFSCRMKKDDGRCSISVENIKSVENAVGFFEDFEKWITLQSITMQSTI